MFDNLSKFLAQEYSQDFASWLLGKPINLTELKPTELSIEPIRTDSVILLKSSSVILHCEFQTDPDPDMGFRMADYSLRIYRKYPNRQIVQVVVYLRQTSSTQVHCTKFSANQFTNNFQVIRLWEQPTGLFLKRPGLLPYAVLTESRDRAATLRAVAEQIDQLPNRQQQSNLAAISAVMAGLSLEKELIQRILRRELMRESVIYQEWQTEAEERGRLAGKAEGEAKGKAEGEAKGKAEERGAIALKMLQENIPLEVITRITGFSVQQLQALQSN